MGDLVMVSPLAWAVAVKGGAGMFLGRPGWRGDIDEGIALARGFDPNTRVLAQLYKYAAATQNGAVLPDAEDVALAAESLELAERSGDNTAVTYALMNRATTLIHGPAGGRALGVEVLTQAREMLVYEQLTMTLRRMSDMELAREKARSGDFDGAIELARTILVEQAETGEMIFRGPATTVLVEALLHRGSTADAHDAREAVDRLAAVPTDPGFVLHELPLLRMRALLARAHGDEYGYRDFRDRYRKMATDVGFEGHMKWAEAMP
jgi:adenylate cyclase